MKWKIPNFVAGFAAVALCANSNLSAEEPVEVLRAQVEELRSDLGRPLDEFGLRYEAQLKALKDEAQKEGDLDLALAVTSEMADYKAGSKEAADPRLKRLQSIYAAESARLKKVGAEKEASLLKGYKKRLEDAVVEETKAGDLAGALGYRNEVLAVEAQMAALATSATVVAKKTPDNPEPPDPEQEEAGEGVFVPGIYQMHVDIHFPRVKFLEDGRYESEHVGSGDWKSRGTGRMTLGIGDKFRYDPDKKLWVGKIAQWGFKEVTLEFLTKDGG